MKINVTYIISNINKALAFEWIANSLNHDKFNLNFILLNSTNTELETYLKVKKIQVDRITYTGKIDIPKTIFTTYKILKKYKTDIVHTHLFDANIIGLTAAWLAGIKKRIYTRHHSMFHHNYYPHAVKYDKFVNWLATDIISISAVVSKTLMKLENVNQNKIHLIHHGFDFDVFQNVSNLSVANLRQKYNPYKSYPVIGVVSRYNELKGIQYIIPAFKKLLLKYPNALLVLANASGDYKEKINELLCEIPKYNYIEITFESDIQSLYKIFDIFVHVPINYNIEAFGQTYIEALASGVPSVFTLSGVANEFIENQKNAIVVPYENIEAISEAINRLIKSKDLANIIVENGKKDVNVLFQLSKMILSLEILYEK